uniref:Transposase n=1 Tax=Rhabditophanes sp. KR3021 TaxID=114890 RepID=A0AC35TV03_9BILA
MSLNVSVRKPLKKRGRKDYVPEIRGADQTIELRRKTHARDVAFDEPFEGTSYMIIDEEGYGQKVITLVNQVCN